MKDEKLDRRLDIASEPVQVPVRVEGEVVAWEDEIDDNEALKEVIEDISFARDNLYDILEKGGEALEDALAIAKSSQRADSYKVVGDIINSLTKANRDLVALQKDKRDLTYFEEPKEKEEEKPAGDTTINNLVITTEALQRMIDERTRK